MKLRTWSRVAALGLLCSAPATHAALCARDQVPAATLLLPWFEVSTACTASQGRNTVFSVSNTSAQSRLARVTLWSNAAVPVLGFDVFMNGFAQEVIDLRALLCDGTLPVTGIGVADVGRHADPETNFTGCNAGATPGASPVYSPLSTGQRADLRAALSGAPIPSSGQCAGMPPDDENLAVGYVTVDTVSACNLPLHGNAGFYAGLTTNNVLAGSAALTDFDENYSLTLPMLAIEAAGGVELAFSNTFYGELSVNQNLREPLPVAWQVDIEKVGNTDDADLLVWRAPSGVRSNFDCSVGPSWHPLPMGNRTGFGSRGWYLVSDGGAALRPSVPNPFRVHAQRVGLPEAGPEFAALTRGTVFANLSGARDAPSPFFDWQGWMGAILRTEGRFARLAEGSPVGAACTAAPFNNTPAPPRDLLD